MTDLLINLVIDDHPQRVGPLPIVPGHFGGRDAFFLQVARSIWCFQLYRIAVLLLRTPARTSVN